MNTVRKSLSSDTPGALPEKLINECRDSLLQTKESLIHRRQNLKAEYMKRDKSGDEVDQSVEILAEHQYLSSQQRITQQIIEIENALARIEHGLYGYCEETEELIEIDRLRAIPWTRLSIEGAEIREALKKRFAR